MHIRRPKSAKPTRVRLSKKKHELSELCHVARRLKDQSSLLYKKAASIYSKAYDTFYDYQTPPGYTDHGALHVHAVLRNADGLLWGLDKWTPLPASENYLLLVAILLHDIGHLEYGLAYDDSPSLCERHAQSSRDLILQNADNFNLDEHEAHIIGQICYSHGIKDYRRLMENEWALEGLERFRVHLVMALLRIADLTDLAYTRAPSFVFKVRRRMPHANKEHWKRHAAIQKVDINCDKWSIVIYARPRSIKQRFELEKFCAWLEEELTNAEPDLQTVGLNFSKVQLRLDESAYRKPVSPMPRQNPFPGLSPFGHSQVESFFGREAFVAKAIAVTENNKFLALVGESGAGKTSALDAGILPELSYRGHAIATYRFATPIAGTMLSTLATALNMPANSTLDEIHEKLNSLRDTHTGLYLHLDQFEEIFTLDLEEGDKKEGFALLSDMVTRLAGLRIIATMRSEFVIDLLELGPKISVVFTHDNIKRLRTLTDTEAREAIERPLLRFSNLHWQPDLVDTILGDLTADEPGVYPPYLQLVCWTLVDEKFKTIRARTGSERMGPFEIGVNEYEQLRRLEGIINRHFQKILDDFSPREREILDLILAEMITAAGLKRPIEDRRVKKINNGRIDLTLAMRKLIDSRVIRRTLIGYELEHDLLARRLLTLLRGTVKASSRIRNVMDHMRMHKGRRILTKEFCKVACLSTAQFNRKFKLETGFTPHKYLEKIRLDEACWLLRETEDTIKDIAARCGFPNPEHFDSRFKEKKKMKPSEYRQTERDRHATEFE